MSNDAELPLVLRSAYLALHRASNAQFASHGVTADQFVLLATLSEGKAITQRELALRMSSDPSTVRAMLNLLEKGGLVRRASHPTDARAKSVSITTAGNRKFQQLWKAGQKIRDKMYDSLDPDEATALVSLLRTIADSLTQESAADLRLANTVLG